jgi:hypothetical protein
MELVELTGARLHVHVALPGLPGEAERATRALVALDPAVVVADVDTREALTLRGQHEPGFVDALVAGELNRRFAKGDSPGDDPVVATARFASARKAELVALRPTTRAPGLFARRRAARALAALTHDEPAAFSRAAAAALQRERAWDASADALAGAPRLECALAGGRAPVALVTTGHRAGALFSLLGRIPA